MGLPVVNAMKTLSAASDGTEKVLSTIVTFPTTLNIAELRLRSSVAWSYASEAGGVYIDVAANAVEQIPVIVQSVMAGQTPTPNTMCVKCNGTLQITCFGNPQAGAV